MTWLVCVLTVVVRGFLSDGGLCRLGLAITMVWIVDFWLLVCAAFVGSMGPPASLALPCGFLGAFSLLFPFPFPFPLLVSFSLLGFFFLFDFSLFPMVVL